MKPALVTGLIALLFLLGCGGGSSSSSTSTSTSKIKKRALVSDKYNGVLDIVDADKDTFNGFSRINLGSDTAQLAVTPDKTTTVGLAPQTHTLVVVDNATETVTTHIGLPDTPNDMAVAPDNKTVYVALRNLPIAGQLPGAVEIVDVTATTPVTGSVNVPEVRRLVLSHNGSKLLAFGDNTDNVAVIDTAAKTVTFVGGFDRPVYGVFSSDDSTAYILSCGAECGGTAARVNTLTLSSGAVGASVPVSGATVGLLDSGNLYVAGNNGGNGTLDIISAANMTVSKSGVAIANGYHTQMALFNGSLFVGSTGCGNVSSGCLSVYNTSSSTVANSTAGSGDVTAIQPITGRTVVYIVEGGELVIWDTSTNAPLPQDKQIDVVGQAYGVVLID